MCRASRAHACGAAARTHARPAARLVKGVGLVGGLLHGLEERKVQAPVLAYVLAHVRQQHQRQEALRQPRVEAGHKQPRGLVHRVRAPVLRVRQVQHLHGSRRAAVERAPCRPLLQPRRHTEQGARSTTPGRANRTSSQLFSVGTILNAFGTLPAE